MEHNEISHENRLHAQGVGPESFPSICAMIIMWGCFFAVVQLKDAVRISCLSIIMDG